MKEFLDMVTDTWYQVVFIGMVFGLFLTAVIMAILLFVASRKQKATLRRINASLDFYEAYYDALAQKERAVQKLLSERAKAVTN